MLVLEEEEREKERSASKNIVELRAFAGASIMILWDEKRRKTMYLYILLGGTSAMKLATYGCRTNFGAMIGPVEFPSLRLQLLV